MAARLKVYATKIGFHDVIVAAPNQKAALAAWDIRDNLFADGAAAVTKDPEAEKAALASPGRPLRRLAGSSDPWKAADQPSATPRLQAGGKARPRRAPDRSRLDKAEAALAEAEAAAEAGRRRLDKERAAFERDQAKVREQLDDAVAAARRRAEAARTAFRKAGGRP